MEVERISKLMARRGLCSRREAEQYMADGRVRVNGNVVTEMGTKVPLDAEIVLDEAGIENVTIILNKPLGVMSNLPQKNYKEAIELITPENRFDKGEPIDPSVLHVIGRLDINSKGLLLMSSDGRVAKAVIGPESQMEKEYMVRFLSKVPEKALEKLRFGLSLDGKPLRKALVKRSGDQAVTMVLREGRNRQIRRMCELVGLEVRSLKRVRIGPLQLGDLPVGKWKRVTDLSEIA